MMFPWFPSQKRSGPHLHTHADMHFMPVDMDAKHMQMRSENVVYELFFTQDSER